MTAWLRWLDGSDCSMLRGRELSRMRATGCVFGVLVLEKCVYQAHTVNEMRIRSRHLYTIVIMSFYVLCSHFIQYVTSCIRSSWRVSLELDDGCHQGALRAWFQIVTSLRELLFKSDIWKRIQGLMSHQQAFQTLFEPRQIDRIGSQRKEDENCCRKGSE